MSHSNSPHPPNSRELIIQAAHELFISHGFHGTSMRQIAAQAGLAVGGIYNHFASKEDIFLAVFLAYHPYRAILDSLSQAGGATLDELLRDAAHRMVAALNGRMDFINLVFIELVEFKSIHLPHVFPLVFPETLAFAERLVAGRPELRPIPLPILVRTFMGMFFSYVMTERIMGGQMAPELQVQALDHFVDVFLYGVLTGHPAFPGGAPQ